jgi:hypothetical protein
LAQGLQHTLVSQWLGFVVTVFQVIAAQTQRGDPAMFEVIVTYRSGFREESIGRFSSDEEAQDCARRLAANNPEVIVRAWVRVIREAKSKS